MLSVLSPCLRISFGHCQELIKLCRQIRSEEVELRVWPVWDLLGFLEFLMQLFATTVISHPRER